MRIALVCIREHQEQPEGPEEKASRYTVRPGTLGLTLSQRLVLALCLMKVDYPSPWWFH
jgi:hypothetical protein